MDDDDHIELPIDGTLDLHTSHPRDVQDLIPDYLADRRYVTHSRCRDDTAGECTTAVRSPAEYLLPTQEIGGSAWGVPSGRTSRQWPSESP
jgi:hypothetical protein